MKNVVRQGRIQIWYGKQKREWRITDKLSKATLGIPTDEVGAQLSF